MIMLTRWFGVFLMDSGNVAEKILFPKEPMEIAQRMAIVQEEGVLQEEKKLAEKAGQVEVMDRRLSSLGDIVPVVPVHVSPDDFGFSDALLKEATLMLGRMRLSEIAEDQDIVHAIRAIEDLNQTFNLLLERLREWYIVYFPDVDPKARDEELIELIVKGKHEDEDVEALKSFTNIASQVSEKKKYLEEFIENKMREVAPNISYLVGATVGAKLIAEAGSLERMGRMPSSTIQILGAEKALFKHLKDGVDPPKHGILFQHPLIHKSPYHQRGKMARALASKVAIAARIDSTTKNFKADALKEKLDTRVKEIRSIKRSPKKKN
jgi:nucleolar protein 56